jgi:hypothetical protein
MSVWLAIPSKRPPELVEPTLKLWRERGYKIALAQDIGDPVIEDDIPLAAFDIEIGSAYPGYAVAVNTLIRAILGYDPKAEWIVTGGDDVEPDPNKTAEEIAESCNWHFGSTQSALQCGDAYAGKYAPLQWKHFGADHTFGVMQPTGDRWGEHDVKDGHKFIVWPDYPERCMICGQEEDAPRHMVGAYIDRVCGSPWIGRQFAARMYRGKGPYWHEYTHMGVDEELQHVAIMMGVLWQRPDLTHYHNHWGRPRDGRKYGNKSDMPAFLEHANSPYEWDRYKRIFRERKAAGFPDHEPLA